MILFCILLLSFSGCQDSLPTTKVPVHNTTLKLQMESLSKSGYLGSGVEEVRQSFAELEKSDPAKAASIKKRFEELIQSEGYEPKIKQIAREIGDKL